MKLSAKNDSGLLLSDPCGRIVDYLRVSVTDHCNQHCLYCMPKGYKNWTQKKDILTAEEIVKTVEAATHLGFRKIRVTGGEPLIRCDIVEILERIWALSGVAALGISTNGTRLSSLAPALKQAGVQSVNISLDSLHPARYRAITGGDLSLVLREISDAHQQGFEMMKLNCVLLRGVNEEDYLPLIRFAAQQGMPIRFIELMPLSSENTWHSPHFFPVEELMLRLHAVGNLQPCSAVSLGHGPARYYDFLQTGMSHPAQVGFIGSLSTAHFCSSCNKIRLTADGKLRPCLGQHHEINLREILRRGESAEQALREAIAQKPQAHKFLETYHPMRPMTAIGG